jgi:hypothetical protein
MKRIKVALLTVAALAAFSVTSALAQEEEGLIPRLMKRFQKKEAKAAPKSAVPKEAPAKPAAQAPVPSKATPPPMSDVAKAAAEDIKAKMPTPVTKVADPLKEMSKGELIKEITGELDDEDEILDYIPNIKKLKDESGKEYYAYKIDEKMVRLEDLGREKLEAILSSIYNQGTLIRTERITRQLETIRDVQNITRQTDAASRRVPVVPSIPQQPPVVPRVTTAPTGSSAQPPAAPPRIPPSPPAQTRR